MTRHLITALLGMAAALLCFPAFGYGGDTEPRSGGERLEERGESIIVTATRTEEHSDTIASSVTVIKAEEIPGQPV